VPEVGPRAASSDAAIDSAILDWDLTARSIRYVTNARKVSSMEMMAARS
jgi:hypothetical protein